MKKIYILFLVLSTVISCGKDDGPGTEKLATPSLNWSATGVTNDVLEISITISSTDNLPTGKIEFKVDNTTVDNFSATKGTQTFTTSYAFADTNEHNASVVYSFTDGRNSVSKTIKIKKLLNETLVKSTREDWEDY